MTRKLQNSREELLSRMEASSGTRRPRVLINQHNATRRRNVFSDEKHTVDQVLHFEIYNAEHPDVISGKRKPDEPLVVRLKDEINTIGLTRRDLYSFIGAGDGTLFENENQAYNLEYGLRKRATISLECAERWLTIIGKELVIEFRDIA
jgi:hypothetical protein